MQNLFQVKNGEMQLLPPRVADRYRTLGDESLCNAVLQGDDNAALFLVFHRHCPILFHLVDRYADVDCRERLLAELVSEIYDYFGIHGWARIVPRHFDKFCGHLYVIERNLILRLCKRDFNVHRGSRVVTSDDYGAYADSHLPPDEPFLRDEARDEVDSLLAGLSATRRFIISKRHLEGYHSDEVAAMLPGFWDSIGERHPVAAPTRAYVDNIVSRTTRQLARQ